MGVDSKLLINSKYNVKDVVKLLTALGCKITQEKHNGDHSFLYFEQEGLLRQLYVSQSHEYAGLSVTVLSYRSNEEGIALFKKIAAVTGGMLCERDCDGFWESIDSPHEGNAYFMLKHAILTNAVTDSDGKFSDALGVAIGYK